MRETLLLRADPAGADHWYWLSLDGAGQPRGDIQAGTLADAAGGAGQQRVVILVPGPECLLTTVQIPGRNRQKLVRAVPYALEEQLSDEVEHLHFAVGDALPDGSWPVAVISRAWMDRLDAVLAEAGLDVQLVVPEILLLPWREQEASVLIEGDVALVRTGPSSGYAADTDNLATLLELQQEADVRPPLNLFVRLDVSPPELDDYAGEVRIETWRGNALGVFAQGLGERTFNLLQGPYSRSGKWGQVWKPLRATAALLLIAVLSGLLTMAVDYQRLSGESERLQAQIEASFRKAAPETRRVVNPRVQMQQLLENLERGGAGASDFMVLLARTGAVLRDSNDIEIGGVSFRAGRLDLDLKIASLQALDQLKQALAGSGGLNVEIQSANTGTDQRVQSRLRIEGTGT